MILPNTTNTARLKIRPLGSSQIGGGSALIALNACTKKIIEIEHHLDKIFVRFGAFNAPSCLI